jgi:hypothetical protein
MLQEFVEAPRPLSAKFFPSDEHPVDHHQQFSDNRDGGFFCP